MVSPRTRGVRGRGTRLKRKAKKQLGSGVLAIICALFTIGISLEGLSISTIIDSHINLLALVGLILGLVAIATAFNLWFEGRKLQKYWKPRKTITQRFGIKRKRKSKSKTKKKKK